MLLRWDYGATVLGLWRYRAGTMTLPSGDYGAVGGLVWCPYWCAIIADWGAAGRCEPDMLPKPFSRSMHPLLHTMW